MARIVYKARNLDGEIVEGRLRVRDEREARLRLSDKGLELVSLQFEASKMPVAAEQEDRDRVGARSFAGFFKPVSTRDLRSATARLDLMLETGTPLAESLPAMSQQLSGSNLGDVLAGVHQSVNAGSTLTEALDLYPEVFGTFYVSAVRAGETTGNLPEVFGRLELHLAKREEMISRMRAALTYPIILMSLATLAIIFLVSFVLPRFVVVFQSTGAILPLPTRMLLGMTSLFQSYWYIVIFLLVAAPLGCVFYLKSKAGKILWDRFVLNLPVVGPLTKTVQSSALLRVLGTLLGSGVPLMESLEVAKAACANSRFKTVVSEISSGVLRGGPFSVSITNSDLFSPSVKQMILTGGKTGKLAFVMNKMADYQDDTAQKQTQKVSALFEPLIIVAMGVVIGFIAVSLMLPLFRMSAALTTGRG